MTGRAEENGLPMSKVSLDLVTENGDLKDSTLTGEDGSFLFNEVPAGSFIVKASYEKDGAVFSIEPSSQPILVSNDDNVLSLPFQITGLTAFGKVETKPGSGLPQVDILVDGVKSGKTNEDGEFILANVKPGVHEILAQKAKFEFTPVNVEINSNNPTVRPIRNSF